MAIIQPSFQFYGMVLKIPLQKDGMAAIPKIKTKPNLVTISRKNLLRCCLFVVITRSCNSYKMDWPTANSDESWNFFISTKFVDGKSRKYRDLKMT